MSQSIVILDEGLKMEDLSGTECCTGAEGRK